MWGFGVGMVTLEDAGAGRQREICFKDLAEAPCAFQFGVLRGWHSWLRDYIFRISDTSGSGQNPYNDLMSP